MTKFAQIGLVSLGVLAIHFAYAQEDVFRTRAVPYVATPQITVDEMLRLAEVNEKDFVIDLGSGDGRLVITAARKFGARGMGMDIDENLVMESEENARLADVALERREV